MVGEEEQSFRVGLAVERFDKPAAQVVALAVVRACAFDLGAIAFAGRVVEVLKPVRAGDDDFREIPLFEAEEMLRRRFTRGKTGIELAKQDIGMVFAVARVDVDLVGHRLVDQIVAFSPAFPPQVYTRPGAQAHTFLGLHRLITDPTAYIEVALVTLGCLTSERAIRRAVPKERLWNVLETYRKAGASRPPATVVYGDRCRPDRNQAELMREFREVTLRPVPCARHNCAAHLKQTGQLGDIIIDAIEQQRGERQARPA